MVDGPEKSEANKKIDSESGESVSVGGGSGDDDSVPATLDKPAKASVPAESASDEEDVEYEYVYEDAERPVWLWVAAGLAAVIAILAVISTAVFYQRYQDAKDHREELSARTSTQEDARRAACAYMQKLVTYDFTRLDDYVNGMLGGAAGQLRKQLEVGSGELRTRLTDNEVRATAATEPECGVKSGGDGNGRIEIVVYATQNIASKQTQGQFKPGPPLFGLLTMEKIDGNWLASGMAAPVAPTQ